MTYKPFFLRQLPQGQNARPPMFVVLCVLSFIGSGMPALAYTFMAANFNEVVTMAESGQVMLPDNFSLFLSGGPAFFALEALLNAVSFGGVWAMWYRRAIGFHLYAGAQLFLALVPTAFLEGNPFLVADAVLSAGFVLMYYLQLKRQGVFSPAGKEERN